MNVAGFLIDRTPVTNASFAAFVAAAGWVTGYRAMGGDERWRRRWMRFVTFFFMTDVLRQTTRNLWRDGALLRLGTWRSALALLAGRRGLVRRTWPLWRAHFRPDFHPSQHEPRRARQWLADNAGQFAVVSRPRASYPPVQDTPPWTASLTPQRCVEGPREEER